MSAKKGEGEPLLIREDEKDASKTNHYQAQNDSNEDTCTQDLHQDENKEKNTDLKTYSKGILCAFFVYVCIGISKICVQALQNRMEHFSLNAVRHACNALFFGIGLLITRTIPMIKRENIKVTIGSCINLTLTSLSMFIPVVYLPLASVESLHITSTVLSAFIIFGLIIRHDKSCTDVSIYFYF